MDGPVESNDRDDDAPPAVHELNRRQRDIFVVGWCSFLVASVGTMLLFAWIDPQALTEATDLPLPMDRMTGYAVGFFFIWVLTAASAALTVYLIRTRHGHPPARE